MVSSPANERDRRISRVLWVILFLNVGVALTKLTFGYFAGAVSMLADGMHSLLDGASNIVGLVAMAVARQPPDPKHPYGHRKFEAIASLIISMFLFGTAYEVLREVLSRLDEHAIQPSLATYVAMTTTLVVNLFVARYERRVGKELRSTILEADSKHTASDVYVTTGVFVSLIAASFGVAAVDLIVAVLIVLFVAHAGYEIIRQALTVLTDARAVDPDEIQRLAMEVEGVALAHQIRSRGTADAIHVDLHIHVDGTITLAEAHEIAHGVVDRIKANVDGVTDVVVHPEPEGHHHDD
ncbi:MAG: cation transporter [Planctomycetes bacterium]|nr:cation transporter [Planctomycetota bacterium]